LDKLKRLLQILSRFALVRETGILLVYCFFTSILSWPYVTRLRDAVVDAGDPYLVSWMLWWDYHQTFTDPLNLFHANIFFPYRYTLAFSEHCYGIALLFFPLFALGLKPLTVHAVAMFLGFATCGYGAFRLTRTLTGSYAAAWLAGIVYAFGPFRFHYMSHLPYLWAMWIPLLFEALILFLRVRSWKRAVWLGIAFLMTGLSTVSWLVFSSVPFIVVAAVIMTRENLWRDRQLWIRGAVSLGVASLALLPFYLPYYYVSKLYGFQRNVEEVKRNSAWPIHWLSAEIRNKLWKGMGNNFPDGWLFRLFPGLLPILFSIAAIAPLSSLKETDASQSRVPRWLRFLDLAILLVFPVTLASIGFDHSKEFYFGVFEYLTSEIGITLLLLLILVRLCIAYPRFFGRRGNLIQSVRLSQRSDAFWVGAILFVTGFLYSLGWNFFFFRILYEWLIPFRSLRVPPRGAMVAYVGLSVLTGLGALRISEWVLQKWRVSKPAFFAVVCVLALFEFNAAPLAFLRGEVFPDSVTLRLKQTPMRGGILVLPAGEGVNYRSMLRAADHAKPLINATSGFITPDEYEIETLMREPPLSDAFLDLLERVPASYVVVNNDRLKPERRDDIRAVIERGVASGRLRFIDRFDGVDDLFVVTKTEPDVAGKKEMPAWQPSQ
jgi:hypothetical protein